MAPALHHKALHSWFEWAETLAHRIRAAQACRGADLGDAYDHHWLAALKAIVAAKGARSPVKLKRYRHVREHAAPRTPHGAPIELQARDVLGA